MNKTLLNRLKKLEELIKNNRSGLFTVHYKDGRTEQVKSGDIIDLTRLYADEIAYFEEHTPRQRNGLLEELCNDLLKDGA